jgi:hypothetical protein
VGRDVQHQRRVDLVAVHGLALSLEKVGEVDGEDVDRAHAGAGRNDCRQSLKVRVMLVRGQENELANTHRLPRVDEVVQQAVQRLAAERGISGVPALGRDVDAVLKGRRTQHAELGREVVGEPLDDDGVAAQRLVRPVLLARSDRDDHPRVAREHGCHLGWAHFLQPARRGRGELLSHFAR